MNRSLFNMRGMDWVKNTVSVKHAAGAILVDGKHVADTLQCVHCSAHWVVVRGSGRRRGWCLRCNGPVCGSPNCDSCIPLEVRLHGWENALTKIQLLSEMEKKTQIFLPSGGVIGG